MCRSCATGPWPLTSAHQPCSAEMVANPGIATAGTISILANLLSGFGASAKPSLNDAFSSGLVAAKDRLLVYFAAERDKWGTVIRKAHIRLEGRSRRKL